MLSNVLLLVYKTTEKTITTMPAVPLNALQNNASTDLLNCNAASTETKSHKGNIEHKSLPQPELLYCVNLSNIRTNNRHLGGLLHQTPHTRSSSWVNRRVFETLTVWAAISVCVCAMIPLAHPGSALIDLLNAQIDCREAEHLY